MCDWAIDRVNPFAEKGSTWSTYLVLLMNYILPWLTMKRHFIMLSLIILGPQYVIGEQFDTYFEPLVEELKLLLEVGVPV
jgi:hypothetical protein